MISLGLDLRQIFSPLLETRLESILYEPVLVDLLEPLPDVPRRLVQESRPAPEPAREVRERIRPREDVHETVVATPVHKRGLLLQLILGCVKAILGLLALQHRPGYVMGQQVLLETRVVVLGVCYRRVPLHPRELPPRFPDLVFRHGALHVLRRSLPVSLNENTANKIKPRSTAGLTLRSTSFRSPSHVRMSFA